MLVELQPEPFMKNAVLLLNSSEEVLSLISWKRAVTLVFAGKADKPHNFEDFIRISTPTGYYDLPSVLILNEYAKIPYKSASLTRNNVFRRDFYKCQYCAETLCKEVETLDHVIPRCQGGKHEWCNVVACCKYCNAKKADRTPEEAKMPLLREPFVPTKHSLIFSITHRGNSTWKKWYDLY